MSPQVRVRADGSVRPVRYRAVQPFAILWLTLVWTALWGSFSPMVVVSGVLVAVLSCLAFPLPPVKLESRVRPWPLLLLALRFVLDIVRASVEVSAVVLRRRPVRNAVVAVDLRSSSDFVMTGVAAMLSLVPGSIVVEARRSTHTLYLHVLDVPDEEAVEAFRRDALAVEDRFLAAFEPLPAPPDGADRDPRTESAR